MSNASRARGRSGRAVPARPGRRDRRHRDWSTTRTSCRGRGVRPHRRDAALDARSTTTAGSTSTTLDVVIGERTKRGRVDARLERARHGQPGGRRRARGACRRRARRARRLPDRAAPAGRLRALGVDAAVVLRAQDARTHRDRRARGAAGAARGAAAGADRRVDGRDRDDDRHDVLPTAAAVRGRDAAGRPGRRAARRRRLPVRLGMDRIAAREHELGRRLLDGVAPMPGVRVLGPTDAADRLATVASPSRTCTRTTSARCSTRPASPSASATTARSRCTTGSGCVGASASAVPLHDRRTRSTPSSRRSPASGRTSGGRDERPLDGLYQQVILDHARERHGRAARAGVGRRGGEPAVQPALRRRGDAARARDRRRRRRAVGDVSWEGRAARSARRRRPCCTTSSAGARCRRRGQRRAVSAEMPPRGRRRARRRGRFWAMRWRSPGSRHANRVKCAMLGWTAFEDALCARAEGRSRD